MPGKLNFYLFWKFTHKTNQDIIIIKVIDLLFYENNNNENRQKNINMPIYHQFSSSERLELDW